LARELRSVLFPIRDGDIFTGTFHDNDIMYDGMIMAFNTAIVDVVPLAVLACAGAALLILARTLVMVTARLGIAVA
jgi:hypothetical protein